jgi:hypothetical protein
MLSEELKKRIKVAITDPDIADELILAIETGVDPQAAVVAAASTSVSSPTAATVSASNVTLSTTDTYSDAAVKAAIDGAVDALKTKIITALGLKADQEDLVSAVGALDSKINQILTAIKAAELMASA